MTQASKQGVACLVLGGGGHAKVVVDSLAASAIAERIAIVDADRGCAGTEVLGHPVVGDDALLAEAARRGFGFFVVGLGAWDDNAPRQSLFDRGREAGLEPLTVVHPSAAVSKHAQIGAGTFVAAAASVNPNAIVGDNVIVNTAAVIEHDCRVGDHALIGPSATVLGMASIGLLALIGAGTVVLPSISVGEAAVVGAGAVVLVDVADGARVAGVPARPLHGTAR